MKPTKETLTIIKHEEAFHAMLKLGYKILLRNYECPLGEIHFIAKKHGELVFVCINEVPPIAAARYYINRYGIADVPVRLEQFDVKLNNNGE